MQQRFPSLDSYINESKLIEKNLKPITKKTWDKSHYDQKCELLQQVVKDIDDVDKYVEKTFDELPDWIIAGMYESRLDESLDDWDPNHNYGVFYIGGSIGDKKDGITKQFGSNVGKLYYTFATADEAKKQAAESRKRLSPGERKYYGMSYKSAPLTPVDKKQIADETGKPMNEGFLTDFITPERMLRSVYDNLKDNVKSIVVEKIDTKNLTFRFTMNDIVSGSVEARQGKILISFDKLVIHPQQYDIVYDVETVLTKDYVRNEVSRIIGRFYDKVNKVR